MQPKERIEQAKAVLRISKTVREAARTLGWSEDSLHNLFRREGAGKPAGFLEQDSFDLTGLSWRNGKVPADRVWVDREPEPKSKVEKPKLQSWLIVSDAHVPFESKPDFNLMLDIARSVKPYGVIIIGDFADMLSVSSHPKTPSQMRWQLKDEVEAVRIRRAQLDELGCVRKVFLTGNHSTRGQRLAARQAIGLYDLLDPNYLFGLTDNGWEVYPYQTPVRVGKVWFLHDCGHSGKYAAHQNGAVFESSTVQGHTHAAGVTYFGNALGERHVSAVIGWLGSKEAADYMAPIKVTRNWTTAFAMMWVEEDTQNSHVQVIPIVEGRAVVNGQLFIAGLKQ